MSNVTLFNQEVPDYLKNSQPSALTKSLAGSTGNKRLSIRGSVFRMVVGGEEVRKAEGRSLQVIIVNGAPKNSRTFYAGTYSADNKAPPSCWSNNGDVPDAAVEEPAHSNCQECPNNIKGSGQGTSRACRFSRRLALQIVGDPTEDVYQFVLPSQSIFGKGDGDNMPFEQYAKYLSGNGRSIEDVITEMSFDTDSATPKLFFKAVAHVSREQHESAIKAGKSDEAKRAIVFTVSQTDAGKKLIKLVESKPVEAKGENTDGADDEVAEPKKRESTKPKVMDTGKKDLAEVMKKWE
jgi:hypothetical protein